MLLRSTTRCSLASFLVLLHCFASVQVNGQQCAATVSNAEQSGSFSVANFSFSDNCKQLEVQVKVAEFNSAVFVQFNSVIIPQVTPDCAFGIYLRNQAGSSRSICTNYTTFSLTMFGNSLIIQFAAKTSFSVTYNAVSNVSSLVANEEKTGVICFVPEVQVPGMSTYVMKMVLVSMTDSVTLTMTSRFSATALLPNSSYGNPVCIRSLNETVLYVKSLSKSATSNTVPVWGLATLGVLGATMLSGLLLILIDIYLRKKSRKINPAVLQLRNGDAIGNAVSTT